MTTSGKKIAIFSALYAPSVGGVEKYTENLARSLAQRGCAVTVVTSRIDESPSRETVIGGVEVLRLPALSLLGGRLPLSQKNGEHAGLLRELQEWAPDYVIVNTRFYAHSIVGLDFARRLGVRPVLIEHGSAYLTLGNPLADAVLRGYEHAMTRRVRRYGPACYGVSQRASEWLGHFGLPSEGVLSNAIDAAAFRRRSSGRKFRKELGIDDEAMVVAFVGRLMPEKGVGALLVAARRVADDRSIVFIVAGDGPEAEAVERVGLPNLFMTGTLDAGDVSALLSCSDVFLLPSRSEGFATSLLESASWGLPALATEVGGAREVLGEGAERLLLEDATADSIVAALRWAKGHREELGALGASSRERVESNYTWEETARLAEAACARANGLERDAR